MPPDETVGQPPSGSANSNDPSTQPAPTVVTSQPAETAIAGAQNNINQYNTNAANVTPPVPATPPPTSTPTATPTPSGSNTPNVNYGSYTDPKTGETSYYAQTGTDSQGNPTYASDPTDPSIALNSGVGAVQIPTPGASGNSVSSPLTPGANVDGNGNIVGTNVPAAVALGSSEDVTSINARLSALNDTITQSGQDSVNMLNGLMNGTIPLSPAQTSVIQNMTTQMNNLIALQTTANTSYVGSITEEQARNGDQSSAPANAMSMVHMAVSNANIQLSSIAAAQGLAISQATDAFQQQDYTQMLAANAQYQDTLKQSQAVLEQLATTIQSSIESARTYNLDVINTQFANNMSSATLTLQQKQDLYQNYISTQNLTLAQKTQAETFKVQTEQASAAMISAGASEEQAQVAQETYEAEFPNSGSGTIGSGVSGGASGGSNGTSSTASPIGNNSDGSAPTDLTNYKYNVSTGQFVDGSGKPITGTALQNLQNNLASAGVKTYPDGLAFLDTSGYTNANAATGAQNNSKAKGILPLSSADAQSAEGLETAKANLDTLAQQFAAIAPNLVTSYTNKVTDIGSAIFDTPFYQKLQTYQSNRDSLFKQINTLAGSSPRLNQNELNIAASALPDMSDILSGGLGSALGRQDTSADGMSKLALTEKYLNNNLGTLVPGFTPAPDPTLMSPTDIASALAGNSGSTSATSTPLTNSSFLNAAGN